jgi:hypothetical protein
VSLWYSIEIMSRWKKEEIEITDRAKYSREWAETAGGIAYKEKHKEYAKEWRKRNPEKKKAIQQRSLYNARLKVLKYYSNKEAPECKCCQEKTFGFLQIDHIEGDGAEHRRQIGKKSPLGGNGFIYWLIKNDYPTGFQVLCANCNYSKRTNKYCIHEIKKGVDMYSNPITEKPVGFPELTRRRRGEAEQEARALGVNKSTLRMKRWREKNPLPKKEKVISTHCKNGHAYADGNLYEWKGHRQCRQCKRDYKSRIKVGE